MSPRAATAALAACILAARLPAQEPCDGRPIGAVRVVTRPLFDGAGSDVPLLVRRIGESLHWQTVPSVVRRELLFRRGEPCDPRRLAETERSLRQQEYLRAAHVTTTPGENGAVDVTVETADEWSLNASARIESGDRGPVRRLRLVEENMLGRGIRGQLRYNNLGRHPGFDIGVLHRQVFARLDAEVVLGNSSVGLVAEQSFLRLFENEFARVSWREAGRYRKEPFVLQSRAFGSVVQPVVTTGGEVGLARRFGEPGDLRVMGAMLSLEHVSAEGPALASNVADDPGASAALGGRFSERRRLRLHVLLGARSLRFTTMTGLDAIAAVEDVREGTEVGMVLGRGLGWGGGLQSDWFGALEGYTGTRFGERAALFSRGKVEGRRLTEEDRWDGVIASGQLTAYAKLHPRSTLVLGLRAAGGWHMSTPFQLLLSGSTGVRGFGHTGLPVGSRVVAQAEQRHFLGTARGALDLGLVGFADVGRGWAGGAPFGEDTGWRVALGAGLRMALPAGSRQVYRLDVSFPLEAGAGPQLRLGFRQQFGVSRGEAEEITRSREQVSSVTVFNFPRF